MEDGLAGVVLAAGAGTRLRPISRWRPKALCPVAATPLVDHALARIGRRAPDLAVNVHHGAERFDAHLDPDVHRSFELPEALGTAGALGALRRWIGGRGVLVTNADAWLGEGIDAAVDRLVDGWDGERHRLLCVRDPHRADFDDLRYCGVALVPPSAASALEAVPSGLYEVAWRQAREAGTLDLVAADVPFVDCGSPADYLRANLMASGGASVVDPRATVEPGARIVGSVVWDGAVVRAGEVLESVVRSAHGTVVVR